MKDAGCECKSAVRLLDETSVSGKGEKWKKVKLSRVKTGGNCWSDLLGKTPDIA